MERQRSAARNGNRAESGDSRNALSNERLLGRPMPLTLRNAGSVRDGVQSISRGREITAGNTACRVPFSVS